MKLNKNHLQHKSNHKNKTRQRKKEKEGKDLDFRNFSESIQLLTNWRNQLQLDINNKSGAQSFLTSFMRTHSIVVIVEKIYLL